MNLSPCNIKFHLDLLKRWLLKRNHNQISIYSVTTISKEKDVSSDKSNSKKYSHTILLPKSKFAMKHTRKIECEIEKNDATFNKLNYDTHNASSDKSFILHDGPPYANGQTHFGHAINKVLKDIIIRSKIGSGHDVHYLPGWDCHGLPIEKKAIKESDKDINYLDIRSKAKSFALETIDVQKKSFMKWGVRGDWDKAYLTLDTRYVTNQLDIFYQLYKKGLIMRAYMPVYWSPSSGTALAEAELEYNHEHISKSVYVKYPLSLLNLPDFLSQFDNLNVLIWTTTPWTLPANQAIAYSPHHEYSVIKIQSMPYHLIVATETVTNLEKLFNSTIEVKITFPGSDLRDTQYINSINEVHGHELLPLLSGDHVTMTKGTGLVHSAPNHGLEDYKLALNHNMILNESLVDEKGCFNTYAGSFLAGKLVLTEGTDEVIKLLKDDIVFQENYTHSYPYDWRTSKPVIMRSSQQWFINMDILRDECIQVLNHVKFYPEHEKDRLIKQLIKRPHWCISRQRAWGVPIPVFYNKDDITQKEPIISDKSLQHTLKLIEKHGPDVWWKLCQEDIVPDEIIEDLGIKSCDLTLGKDILDIWFDSGISWSYALPEPKIADLYLEGIDQVRGWFQSSLITSVALRNCAPYKQVFVHGFALDSQGKKMSKSLGNVINPDDIIEGSKSNKAYGVDGLRWWIAMHANGHENVNVAMQTFDETNVILNKIRNLFRFILGSLDNFDSANDICTNNELTLFDQYMLHLISKYSQNMNNFYANFQLNSVTHESVDFIFNQISALYFSRIKDRLYCEEEKSLQRRSCQTVLYHLNNILLHQLSPILIYITHEVQQHSPINTKDIMDSVDDWKNDELAQLMDMPLAISNSIFKHFLTGIKLVEYDCYIKINDGEIKKQFEKLFQSMDVCEVIQTSSLSITDQLPSSDDDNFIIRGNFGSANEEIDVPNDYEILLLRAKNYLCDRCRRHTSLRRNEPCQRCIKVIASHWA